MHVVTQLLRPTNGGNGHFLVLISDLLYYYYFFKKLVLTSLFSLSFSLSIIIFFWCIPSFHQTCHHHPSIHLFIFIIFFKKKGEVKSFRNSGFCFLSSQIPNTWIKYNSHATKHFFFKKKLRTRETIVRHVDICTYTMK